MCATRASVGEREPTQLIPPRTFEHLHGLPIGICSALVGGADLLAHWGAQRHSSDSVVP